MKNKIILCFFIASFFSNCESDTSMRRLGYLHKMSQTIEIDNNVIVEDTIRFSRDCHFGESYQMDANFINKNLHEMANGDNSVIGYRNLKIEFKLYPILTDRFGIGVFGLFCTNFSGYALHKSKMKSEQVETNNE